MNPLLLFALVGVALADVDVQVGQDGQLRFSPETIKANIGELVNFHFHGSTHSATESTARLQDPCHPLGGFDTGIQKDGSVKSIVVSTHNSIYVHCTPHCGKGMVMIVNPGSNDNVETFRKAAIAQEGGGASGGGGNTPSSTSSSTSSRASSSPSTGASPSTSSTSTVIVTASSTSGSTVVASVTSSVSITASNSSATAPSQTTSLPFTVSSSTTSASGTATSTGAAVALVSQTGSLAIILSSLLALFV